MAMAVDNRQQSQLNAMGYDAMRYPPQPQFTNPWAATTAAPTQLYPTHMSTASPVDASVAVGRPATLSIPYHGLQVTAPGLGAGISLSDGFYEPQNLLDPSQDMMNASRTYATGYSASAPQNPNGFAAPTSAAAGFAMEFPPNHSRSPFAYAQDAARRSSHPLNSQPAQRNSFSEALDAGRGLLGMSQDITPRNIYGTQASSRSSTDSYGFPSSAHSTHSSISSASTYPYYSGAEGSVTDYSSASESVDNSRTLPRPSAMAGGIPPAPQSMMGQFSSKVSSSSQKKHKCKVCDKRFTRPSSLQTHMYSHTGEKPFSCEVEGCGRNFSVVSNLRRHRKVHKNERDHPSPDDM